MVVSRSASLPIGSPAKRVIKGTILVCEIIESMLDHGGFPGGTKTRFENFFWANRQGNVVRIRRTAVSSADLEINPGSTELLINNQLDCRIHTSRHGE